MKGIVITPDNEISVRDFGDPLHLSLGDAVGGYIEHVHPILLPDPYCMIVDDEGLLKELPYNPVGGFLYGTQMHGSPIVGTIVIMKDGFRDGERDIVGLDDDDVKFMFRRLKKVFNLKGDITND